MTLTPHRSRHILASTLLLAAATTAQSVAVGGLGTYGCQGPSDPPTITGGVLASGTVAFAYDATTHVLTLDVDNTSAVVPGQPNPQIHHVFFNVPDGAVTGAVLNGQSAAGGAAPNFSLRFGSNHGNCFGSFDVELATSNNRGGIGNASADTFGGHPPALGPVRFEITLSGPGVGSLTATSIRNQLSTGAPNKDVNVALKFKSGGNGGEESGVISNRPDCSLAMYTIGEPRIGNTITVCENGAEGCHNCLWIGLDDTPVDLPGIRLPFEPDGIVTVGEFDSTHTFCFPITIPNDRSLIGTSFFFAIASFPRGATRLSDVVFSTPLEIVIQG